MTITTAQLGELLPAAREGIEFYEYAARRIEPVSLRVVFHSMAKVRYDFVRALCAEVVTHHRPHGENQSFHVQTRRLYRRIRNDFAISPDKRHVAALIRHEATLLEALHDGFEEASDEGHQRVSEILRVHLPRMHACHEELERLQAHLV